MAVCKVPGILGPRVYRNKFRVTGKTGIQIVATGTNPTSYEITLATQGLAQGTSVGYTSQFQTIFSYVRLHSMKSYAPPWWEDQGTGTDSQVPSGFLALQMCII